MSSVKTGFNIIEEQTKRLAVLIDDDNVSPNHISAILTEIAKYGEATVKRIYGNFVSKNGQWKEIINAHAIKPMQQFAFTTGKNATDGYMIIDAMDLLYTNRFDGFCIISSDSDFTALAIRLKEQGATVYGFGEKKTPKAFRNACSQFIYIENLLDNKKENESINSNQSKDKTENKIENVKSTNTTQSSEIKSDLPLDIIVQVFESFDDEWITAAAFASTWKRLQIDMDPRSYGCKKFTDLVKKYDDVFDYELREMENDSTQRHMYVKLKK